MSKLYQIAIAVVLSVGASSYSSWALGSAAFDATNAGVNAANAKAQDAYDVAFAACMNDRIAQVSQGCGNENSPTEVKNCVESKSAGLNQSNVDICTAEGKQVQAKFLGVPFGKAGNKLGGDAGSNVNSQPVKQTTNSQSADSTDASTSTAPSQSEAQSDVNSCASSQSSAVNTCSNPMSSLSQADQQTYQNLSSSNAGGIAGSCEQMKTLASQSSALNSKLAGVCSGGQQSCLSTCSALINKYRTAISTCNGCAGLATYQSVLSNLTAQNNSCTALQSKVQALASQSTAGAGNQAYAANCLNSATNPSSLGGLAALASSLGGGGSEAAAQSDPYGCASNPSSPECAGTPQAAAAMQASTAGFAARAADAGTPSFNPDPTTNGLPAGMNFPVSGGATANKAGTVANNSGGAIPQGNNGAQLGGPAGRGAPAGGGGGVDTNIMRGFSGGGGGSFGGGSGGSGSGFDDPSFSTQPSRRGPAAAGGAHAVNIDLKQYLPGGILDPNRRLGGMTGSMGQINGRGRDIFQIISLKMTEKCKLGVLLGCQ